MRYTSLEWTRRIYCVIVLLIGLFTIVFPTISLDTPVLGRSQWSPLDILTEIQSGSLPVPQSTVYDSESRLMHDSSSSNWWMNPVARHLEIIYLSLLIALLLTIFFPRSPTIAFCVMLAAWGALGATSRHGGVNPSLDGRLERLFYGQAVPRLFTQSPVNYMKFTVMVVAVSFLVMGILFSPGLDGRDLPPEPDGPPNKDLAQDVTFELEHDRLVAQNQDKDQDNE